MVSSIRMLFLAFLALASSSALAAPQLPLPLPEHAIGSPDAPIRVDEYLSTTCSHCAHFYLQTLPKLDALYVKTGKVRFVLHNFPLDGFSLKTAAVAECMPKDGFFPFIKTVYSALIQGQLTSRNAEQKLFQIAALGGLAADKAKACANDTALQNAIIEARTRATEKYDIRATLTFIINEGAEVINGAQSTAAFSALFDKMLAARNK